MANLDDEKLSLQLKDMIFKSGHNNSTFAEKIGVTEGAIRKLVNKSQPFNPSARTLVGMADVLGVTTDKLLGREQEDDI